MNYTDTIELPEGGELLRNGARVLRESPTPPAPGIEAGRVVLAEVDDELVTWWVRASDGIAFWGHYFEADERASADRDYDFRVERGY